MAEKNYARKSKISEDQRKEIAEFYRDSKLWGVQEVADIYDISPNAVRYAVKKYGCQKSKSVVQNYTSKLENIAQTSSNVSIIEDLRNTDINSALPVKVSKPGFFRKFGKYAALAAGTIAAVALTYLNTSCNKSSKYEEPASHPTIVAYTPNNFASNLLAKTDELQNEVKEVKALTHELKEEVVTNSIMPRAEKLKKAIKEEKEAKKMASTNSVDNSVNEGLDYSVELSPTSLPISAGVDLDSEIEMACKNFKSPTNDLSNSSSMVSNTLDSVVDSLITSDSSGEFYGLAGVGAVGDVNFTAEFGYKNTYGGLAISLDNTAFQLKYGLSNLTDAEIDTTFSAGNKSFGVMFTKDNVFGEDKSWNVQYGVGLGIADGFVASGYGALVKKLDDSWNLGLEARINAGNNSNIGGFLTLSYGNRTFEDAMPGFEGANVEDDKDSDKGTSIITQPTTSEKGNNRNDETTPVNPPINPPTPTPTRTDGTGQSDLR